MENPDGGRERAVAPPTSAKEEKGNHPGRGGWGSFILEMALLFFVALVVALFLQAYFIKPFLIPSPSMEPTLREGDRVLADRITYHFRKPRRGEIVVFRFPPADPDNWTKGSNFLTRAMDLMAEVLNITHQEGHPPFIKRVVGIEGDLVELRDGVLFVNGEEAPVDYQFIKDEENGSWTVPPGCVMVMGDNRPNSNDSRRWGFVPYGSIIGRAVLIWWPPGRWSIL